MTARQPMTLRELVTKWKWLILPVGGILFALTVIFPQIGAFEWISLIPALLVILTLAPDPTVRYRRLYGLGLCFFWPFYAVNFHWFLYMYPLDFAGMSHAASAVVVGFACLGLSLGQAETVAILQSAALFGSYFITFLMVAVNGLLAYLILHPSRRMVCAALALGLFFGNMGFGIIRMASMKDEGTTIQAAAIQGNKGSLENWGSGSMDAVLKVYGELSKKAAAEGADLIVWPETCIPANIDRHAWVYEYVTELSRECGVPILCGLFTRVEEGSEADYNSIVAALPDGTIHDTVYNKRNPVPFGEFVPFRNLVMTLVPPLAEINTLAEDIPAGEDSVVFDLEIGQVGSLICFDSIYEQNALDSIANGAQVLAVSTNDSWFQDSRGVWMHHAQSQLRAIETGRFVVRSANTGVSSIINDRGEVLETLAPLKTGYVLEEVTLSERVTVYSVIGNVFAYACIILCAAAILYPACDRILSSIITKCKTK